MWFFDFFRRDRRGNVAVTFALAAIPLLGATGAAVDYGRASVAKSRMADALDSALIAVGSKSAMSDDAAKAMITDWVNTQLKDQTIGSWKIASFSQDGGKIDVTVSGTVPTTVASILGISSLPIAVASQAVRSINKLEVALVLDTTASMNQPATKMSSLKQAATDLVTKITADPKADVKIAVIPYGQYVNIGVANRKQPWVSVPDDYNTTKDAYCDPDVTSATVCDKSTTTKTSCTKYSDGVPYTTTCSTTTCTASHTVTYDPPKKGTCYAAKTTPHVFSGCVGSPNYPDNVTDDNASRVYPGYIDLTCNSTMIPLTTNVATVKSTISGLTAKDNTYIPSGLAWGFNALSSAVPLTEAAAYDSSGRNINPSKALVLMTDGFNTVLRNTTTNKTSTSFGRHDKSPGTNSDGSTKIATQTNTWTTELCNNIKAKNIEVFTVAYALDSSISGATEAKTMLKNCASNDGNFYDAADSAALLAAFSQIAEDMNNLRLSK
jgi:Flp pilus assembly protein TadG